MSTINILDGYIIRLNKSDSYCIGQIRHKSVKSFVVTVGNFIAEVHSEDETFADHIQIDIFLRDDLKYDSKEGISVDVSNIESFAVCDLELHDNLRGYEKIVMPCYNPSLVGQIVKLVKELYFNELPVGVNLYKTNKPKFLEYGVIWKR